MEDVRQIIESIYVLIKDEQLKFSVCIRLGKNPADRRSAGFFI